MPTLEIRANQVLGSIFGHTQIVYRPDEGVALEIEVQGSTTDWVVSPVQEWVPSEFGETVYIFTSADLVDRDVDAIWTVLQSARDIFAEQSIDYQIFNQNSNSYITTLLHIVDINVFDLPAKLFGAGIEQLPGVESNVLLELTDESGDALEPFALTLNGTDEVDFIRAGSGRDVLRGGNRQDNFFGKANDDLLYGEGGGDILIGGLNEDRIYGGSGSDVLSGGAHSDTLFGNGQFDTLFGGTGEDVLFGGFGDDVLAGGSASDVLKGAAGDDRLAGERGKDILRGGAGADDLNGDAGNDTLFGGAGEDILTDSTGKDSMTGGKDADVFVFDRIGGGHDVIVDFTNALDVLSFQIDRLKLKDLTITGPADALIEFGDRSITLLGVSADDLSEDDFSFL